MTIGEYAKMIWAEKWMSERAKEDFENAFKSGRVALKLDTEPEIVLYKRMLDARFRFIIIPCENYSHKSRYELPVKPSPNLPEIQSIYWYPSTCFFEGTVLSEGRGTEKPFQIFGHPTLPKNLYQFTPVSKPGATEPKLKNQRCYGWNISGTPDDVLKKINNKIQLKYLIDAYRLFPDKDKFFIKPASGNMDEAFFNKLVGNSELMKQLKDRKSEEEIRKTWQPKLIAFKKVRKKYLLYPDFE